MIEAFMRRSYTMVINIRDKAEKFYCQVKVLDLKRETDTKYRISLLYQAISCLMKAPEIMCYV